MWLQITNKVIDIPGIFIVKDNPITIGAWSVLQSDNKFVLWIHKKRYTASLLTVGKQKCTFSIIDNITTIHYCGRISGRDQNKLSKISTVNDNGYKYLSDSEYVILIPSINSILPIDEFYLVICPIERIVNNRRKETWVKV